MPAEERSAIFSRHSKLPDPQMQRFWTDFPCENDTPTIEEIIYHLAEKFAKES